jgi:hypothetical protein
MLFRALMFNPITSPDFSSASIYRIIEGTGGTILIDDFDDLPEDIKQNINRHIKVNYKPFNAFRSDGGRKFRPHAYDSYSHLVLNNTIGIEDSITQERVITYPLLKHKDAPTIGVDYRNPICGPIRDDCYICVVQYWKIVKESYEKLKVKELKIRDLELFQPLLAIANIIDKQAYNYILSYGVEYVEQLKLEDLSDDWEYLLFKYIIDKFEKVKLSDLKRTLEFPVNDIATDIHQQLYYDLPPKDRERKLHQLRKFIGGKLRGCQFKKTRPHNYAIYHINAEKLIKILDVKNMLGLFKDRLALLGLLADKQQKKIELISKKNQKSLDQVNEIRKIQDFCNITKNKDGFTTEKSIVAFIKNRLNKKDPESYYQHLLQNSVLTLYSGKGIQFTGG